jgi:hypothetical protein
MTLIKGLHNFLNEDSRSRRSDLDQAVLDFTKNNKEEINSLAAEDLWEEIYAMLEEAFPEEDQEEVASIFNKIYNIQMEESEDDPDLTPKDLRKVPGMSYASWSRSALGVNQKLTESKLRRLEDF